MKVRCESVQTRSVTGTRRHEALRHTRAVCRRTERRDCPSQPRIRAWSRSFMNNAGEEFAGCRDDDRGRIASLIHQIGLHDQCGTKLPWFGSHPWVEVHHVQMPALDLHLRSRDPAAHGCLRKLSMFSFVGVRATMHGFLNLMPQPLLCSLLFEGLQRGSQHPGHCRDPQFLPQPFGLLLFFFWIPQWLP